MVFRAKRNGAVAFNYWIVLFQVAAAIRIAVLCPFRIVIINIPEMLPARQGGTVRKRKKGAGHTKRPAPLILKMSGIVPVLILIMFRFIRAFGFYTDVFRLLRR